MDLESEGLNADSSLCEHGNALSCEICGENQESKKSEKEMTWDKNRAEVEKNADRLGKGVDEKIKETIAAFMAYEFPTSGSCEGHLAEENKEKRGLPYPWVEIEAPEPEGWRENEALEKEWTLENLNLQQKMMELFSEFYQDRNSPFDARLTFEAGGALGRFRVQSFGSRTTALLSHEDQKSKLELYRKEMNDFSRFLKNKFFKRVNMCERE